MRNARNFIWTRRNWPAMGWTWRLSCRNFRSKSNWSMSTQCIRFTIDIKADTKLRFDGTHANKWVSTLRKYFPFNEKPDCLLNVSIIAEDTMNANPDSPAAAEPKGSLFGSAWMVYRRHCRLFAVSKCNFVQRLPTYCSTTHSLLGC